MKDEKPLTAQELLTEIYNALKLDLFCDWIMAILKGDKNE